MDDEERDYDEPAQLDDTLDDREPTERGSETTQGTRGTRGTQGTQGTRGSRSRSSQDKKDKSLAARQQQLFLIEFLVDTVSIDSCSVDEEILQGQTCLTLNFLNFPPMEICEKDFDPNKEKGVDKVRFNCGKSLMFAFNDAQCERPPPLSLEMTVSKKLDNQENPAKVDIGTIKVCIAELFRQIVDIAKYKPDKLPSSKSIKDCFMLIGPGKRTMGEVGVYIRLSCLGQNIVTEFQCGPDLKKSPVLFKNRDGKKVFEFSGSYSDAECEAAGGKDKAECCLPKEAAPSPARGGQGDGGRSSPSVGATYSAKGNKVVLDIPEKPNRYPGGQTANQNPRKGDFKQLKAWNGLSVAQGTADPDQNCFVLMVGDKGQIPDRGKMILEFRTPKQKIIPKIIPPYHEDIAVQTDSQKKAKGKKKK